MTGSCPCGSARTLAACCGRYLDGAAWPPTAEALMRARYTAYCLTRIDFLLETFVPEKQYLFDRETTVAWARRSSWTALEVKRCERGGADDEDGTVEFVAWYDRAGRRFRHHEVSEFRKVDGRWYYVDGRFPSSSALLGAESRRLKDGTR
jgi:SEC-C motif-containing protein